MGKVLAYLGMTVTVLVLAVTGAVLVAVRGADDTAAPVATGKTYVYRVEVPAGTAEKIKLGQRELYMPLRIDLHVGDSIELINHDSVVQAMGPFRARPGETVRHTFTEPIRTVGSCTFEPGGMPVYINVLPADGTPPIIDGRVWGA